MHRVRNDSQHPFLNIHSACLTGNLGLVLYALNAGVGPSSPLDGLTPLHAACAGTSLSEPIVKLLLDRGADVNAIRMPIQNRRGAPAREQAGGIGYTPLHFAAAAGHASIIPLLLSAGADPTIPDKLGFLPHHIAHQAGYYDLESLLQSAASSRPSMSSPGPSSSSISRKLLYKKSLENAFLHRKTSLQIQRQPLPPSPTAKAFNFTPQVVGMTGPAPSDLYAYNTRRPSLPQTMPSRPIADREYIKEALLGSPESPKLSPSSSSPSPVTPTSPVSKGRKEKRPRSAGASAEAGSKRLGTKYSLLNLLRRQVDAGEQPQMPPSPSPSDLSFYARTPPTPMVTLPPESPALDSPGSISTSPRLTRPGILRAHGRSSSNSTSNHSPEMSHKSSVRTLRFDSPSPAPQTVRKSSDTVDSEADTIVPSRDVNLEKRAMGNRARAGTNSSVASTTISSPGSPKAPMHDILADPNVPEYSSDLSDDEDDEPDQQEQYATYRNSIVSTSSDGGEIEWSSPSSQQFHIRTHKDAQELVQHVQREILANVDESGESLSLQDQLAAYGETLAIERRFARRGQRSASGSGEDRRDVIREMSENQNEPIKRSVSGGGPANAEGGKSGRVKRPYTSNGVVSRPSTADTPTSPPPFNPSHQSSKSLVIQPPLPTNQDPDIHIIRTLPTPVESPESSEDTFTLPPGTSNHQHSPSYTATPPSPRRPSHGQATQRSPSRMTHDIPEEHKSSPPPLGTNSTVFPIPLSRTTSHPVKARQGSVSIPLRTSPDPTFARVRNMSSTPKLSRMGFSADPFTIATPNMLTTAAEARPDGRRRFGGFKNLVQSIKGRS